MVYGYNEVGKRIEKMNAGSTLFDGKVWTVEEGVTRYSEDWGNTWIELENNLPSTPNIYRVHFTKSGTMIVSKNREIYRAEAPYTDFTYVLGLATTQSTVSRWGFTEDNDGYIYMVEYANYYHPDNPDEMMNVMYIRTSSDEGRTWETSNVLQHTDSKHFHQIKYNPYDDTLYITTGDTNKLVFKSKDKGQTWTEIIPTDYPNKDTQNNTKYGGHTGLAFFSTGEILWGTDWQPLNPDTQTNWNWFVRSQGSDPDSFVYQKMEKEYYGMSGDIVTEQTGSRAWTSLRDEFKEDDVYPVLMFSDDKGISWQPLIRLPRVNSDTPTNDLEAGSLIAYADMDIKDSPYIFWQINNYGVLRISKDLVPYTAPILDEPKPSKKINDAAFFINDNGIIKEVEVYTSTGKIKNTDKSIGV